MAFRERLQTSYRARIGEPTTGDEVRGYWLFVAGVVLGALGILLFLGSTTMDRSGTFWTLRGAGIVLGAISLPTIVTGFVVRLPLARLATRLTYAGAAISALALVWFLTVYPGGLGGTTTAEGLLTLGGTGVQILLLYALGLFVQVVGGVVVPLVTTRPEREAQALRAELHELEATLDDTAADEADLAAIVRDLREAVADTEADEEDLATMVADLRASGADAAADEADLAAQLRSLRTSQSRFELYEDRGGEWRWRLRHSNGNLVANSGEGYTRRHNAQKGMEAVRRDALGATVLLIEDDTELPPEDEAFEPVEEESSRADFELYEDQGGEWRWRLRHDNGNIIADSAEGYTARRSAESAIDGLRGTVGPAEYLWPDPTVIEVYRDQAGEWRWRLVHRNGNILADSGEGYSKRSNARRALDRIREGIDGMDIEVYEDQAGEYRWRLLGGGGQVMGDSGEGYSDRSEAEEAVERVERYLPGADLLDIGQAAFEIYEDRGNEFRWRLRHRNGQILADGAQGYDDRSGARDGIESVKLNAPNADLDVSP